MLSSWPNALLELSSSGAWEPTRPWAAVLLLLPLFLLLFSLRRVEQRTVLLGTARFFSGLSEGGGRSSSRRLTTSRVLAALALLAATGAAMGPAPRRSADPEISWLVVVDRSPSMYLEAAAGSGRSRLDAALVAARALLEGAGVPSSRVRYVDGSTAGATVGATRAVEAAPPAALLDRPTRALPEPSWGAFDREGVLWVTDRAPSDPPSEAGWVASGGEAVPGPVGWGPEGALLWDGPGTEPRSEPALRPRAWIGGPLDPVLGSFVAAWAAERGVMLVEDREEGTELVVEGAGPVTRRVPDRTGGRDGWEVSFAVDGSASGVGGQPWWSAEGDGPPRVLVTRAPGRVSVAPLRLGGAPSPADAFAVSMAALLDGALDPPRWLAPLAERESAGSRAQRAPVLPAMARAELDLARGERERGERFMTAALALVASALAACAAVVRARESRQRLG